MGQMAFPLGEKPQGRDWIYSPRVASGVDRELQADQRADSNADRFIFRESS